MRVALTGATGLAGHPIAAHLARRGFDVVTLGRAQNGLGLPHVAWTLGERPRIDCDALVHCAFSHVRGRYRGGEDGDPDGFLHLNRDGTLRLLDGVGDARIVYLSSRAVYGRYPPGTCLREDMEPCPNTIYGDMKRATETAVAARGGVSLRATGLYGPPPPGRVHKWAGLFADFAAGHAVPSRVATELHVGDLASAVELCLGVASPSVANISDIVLDHRDLLAAYAEIAGIRGCLPNRADASCVSAMDCERLRALGWMPRGEGGLRPALAKMVESGATGRPGGR